MVSSQAGLSVVHVFRSPVGGLFRHVCDLTRGQVGQGLRVGLFCDADNGDEESDRVLREMSQICDLGIHRIPIPRSLALSDVAVMREFHLRFRDNPPAIVHGHGAKGGAIARTAARLLDARSVYTPHGGALHYEKTSPLGALYLLLERILKRRTNGFLFESIYAQRAYEEKIGRIEVDVRVVYNGLKQSEFSELPCDSVDADFVFVGELRLLKGIEVLVKAIAIVAESRKVSLLVVGSGPDRALLERLIISEGVASNVFLLGPIYPSVRAFERARCVVVPSLAESFPYIVLEAAAAQRPIIATSVGGIPEIYGELESQLIQPGSPEILAQRMLCFLENDSDAKKAAGLLRDHVQSKFTYERMIDNIITFYQQVLEPGRVRRMRSTQIK